MIQTLKYAPHEIAKIFPEATPEEKRELTQDIRKHGLQEPIILFEGKVLDGRTRQEACAKAGIKPSYKRFEELSSADTNGATPLAWAVSHNLKRRHLRPSQLAILAAETIPAFEREAKQRQLAALKKGKEKPTRQTSPNGAGGRSAQKAAKAAGVSETNVKKARRLLKEAPDKAADVKAGKMTIHKAVTGLHGKTWKVTDKPKKLTMQTTIGEIIKTVRRGDDRATVIIGHWRINVIKSRPV